MAPGDKLAGGFKVWPSGSLLDTDTDMGPLVQTSEVMLKAWMEGGRALRTGVQVGIEQQAVMDCLGHCGQGAHTAVLSHGSTVERSALGHPGQECPPEGGYPESDLPPCCSQPTSLHPHPHQQGFPACDVGSLENWLAFVEG